MRAVSSIKILSSLRLQYSRLNTEQESSAWARVASEKMRRRRMRMRGLYDGIVGPTMTVLRV